MSFEVKWELILETIYEKFLKFGEPFKMAIPSQALKKEGVET